jgi:hypothetical protein
LHASRHITLGSQTFRNITLSTRSSSVWGFSTLLLNFKVFFLLFPLKPCEQAILPLPYPFLPPLTCGTPFGHLQPMEPELLLTDDRAPHAGRAPPGGRVATPWGRRCPSMGLVASFPRPAAPLLAVTAWGRRRRSSRRSCTPQLASPLPREGRS